MNDLTFKFQVVHKEEGDGRKAADAKCTEKLIEVPEQIIKSSRSEVRLVARAKITWHGFYRKRNDEFF